MDGTTRHPASAVSATKPGRHAVAFRKLDPASCEWQVANLRKAHDYATGRDIDVVDLVRPVVGGTDDDPQHAERLYGVPLEDLSDPSALPDDAMVDVYLSNDNSKDTTELDSASFRQTLWEDVLLGRRLLAAGELQDAVLQSLLRLCKGP